MNVLLENAVWVQGWKGGKVEMVLNSSTLALQQCCTIALSLPPSLPPQHPLQRGGEGLITALSRNWSMFNSSGELTGYTHEMAFGCLFVFFFIRTYIYLGGVAAVTNSDYLAPNFDFVTVAKQD